MKARAVLVAAGLIMIGLAARATAAPRPVVVELFTSQACSDCPPAEALLRRLQAAHPDAVLALAVHVTYFNGPGWRDPFSFHGADARQDWYAGLMHRGEVFTPQAVIDGRASAVGSDRRLIVRDIAHARARAAKPGVVVTIRPVAGGWTVALDGTAAGRARIDLFRYDAIDRTSVRGGENGGRRLSEIHVVRAISRLGEWTGQAVTEHVAAGVGRHIAVLVQRDDGTIIGAASA